MALFSVCEELSFLQHAFITLIIEYVRFQYNRCMNDQVVHNHTCKPLRMIPCINIREDQVNIAPSSSQIIASFRKGTRRNIRTDIGHHSLTLVV